MTKILEGQVSMFDLDLPSGKMFQEPSAATKEKTSAPCSKPFPKSGAVNADGESIPTRARKTRSEEMLFLNLKGDGGNLLGVSWEILGVLPGVSTTLNFGEFPSDARESTLSQILQESAPEKYSLSPKACAGIVRRAEKRGKTLPDMLKDALMEVIGLAGVPDGVEDDFNDEDL